MKKNVLSAMLLFSVSCLLPMQGRAGMCPIERPLLIGGEWKNKEYIYPENITALTSLKSLIIPSFVSIPNSPDCKKNKSDDCQKLADLQKQHEEKIKKWRDALQNENQKIEKINRHFSQKNDFFRKNDRVMAKYRDKLTLHSFEPFVIVDTIGPPEGHVIPSGYPIYETVKENVKIAELIMKKTLETEKEN